MHPRKKLKWATESTEQVATTSIHSLPSEILIRIFSFAVNSQSCPLRNAHRITLPALVHPDSLLLVCYHWYDIATTTRSLWSHIDIVLACPQNRVFRSRAKVHATRAGGIPLDIHIIDASAHYCQRSYELMDWSQWEFLDFDKSVPGPRSIPIRSLELAAYSEDPYYRMLLLPALRYYLSKSTPATLAQISIQINPPGGIGSHESIHRLTEFDFVKDSLNNYTEKMKGSLKVLHLKGVYPYWTSPWFHGLVDLRLEGGFYRTPSRLQTLCLNCRVTHGVAKNEALANVHLEQLEMLDIRYMDLIDATTILRRFSYGPKPLRLCLYKAYCEGAISEIFQSSNWNVMELRIVNWSADNIVRCVAQFPRIQSLVIGTCTKHDCRHVSVSIFNPPPSLIQYDTPDTKGSNIRLHTLSTARSTTFVEEVRALIDRYSVRKLVLWSRSYYASQGRIKPLNTKLLGLCSAVETLEVDGFEPRTNNV